MVNTTTGITGTDRILQVKNNSAQTAKGENKTSNDKNQATKALCSANAGDKPLLQNETKKLSDGSVLEYKYANGIIVSATKTATNGDITNYIYQNGIVTSATKKQKDGSKISYAYTDGKVSGAVKDWPDGSKTTYVYQNGVKSTAVKKWPDGSQTNYTYKNGVIVDAKRTWEDGSYTDYTYKDGIIVDAKKFWSDKSVTNYTYKDGVVTAAKRTWTDGSVTNYDYQDGKIVSAQKNHADGAVTKYKYENGQKVSAVKTLKDKSTTITYTYANDTVISAVREEKNATIKYDYVNGKAAYAEKTVYADAKKTKISKKQVYNYNDDGKSVLQKTMDYAYQKNGQLSCVTTKDSAGKVVTKDTYGYDNGGDINSITTTAYKPGTNTVIAQVTNNYTYNREAKPTVVYTEQGLLIEFDENNAGESKTLLINNGQNAAIVGHALTVTSKDGKQETQYSSDGEVTKYIVKNGSETFSYTYKDGVKSSAKMTLKDGSVINCTYQNGKIISATKTDKKGKKSSYKVSDAVAKDKYNPTQTSLKTTPQTISTYKEDACGNILQEVKTDQNGNIVSITNNIYKNGKYAGKETVSYDNGKVIHTSYNSENKPTVKLIENSHGEKKEIKYTYDTKNGEQTRSTIETHYMADGSKRAVVETHAVYKNGEFVKTGTPAVTRKVYHSKTKTVFKNCTYDYDNGIKLNEKLVTTIDGDGKATNKYTVLTYDTTKKDGKHETSRVETVYPVSDKNRTGKPTYVETYKNDSSGKKVSSERRYSDGSVVKFKFDSKGKRTKV